MKNIYSAFICFLVGCASIYFALGIRDAVICMPGFGIGVLQVTYHILIALGPASLIAAMLYMKD